MRTKIAYSLLLAIVILLGAAAARVAAQNAPAPGQGMPGMEMFTTEEERARMTAFVERAQSLRYLTDADVRTEIGITPEQDQAISQLRERGTNLAAAIRAEIQAKIQARMRPDMTPEEGMALRLEAMQTIADAIRDASADFEKMLGEADAVLTPRQKKQLITITRERAALEEATGNLAVLLTAEAREACSLTLEQIDQICALLKSLANETKQVRDKMFGADKELTKEDKESAMYKEFQTLRADMIARTRDKVLAIFATEQRDKVEKFLATHRGFRERRGGFGAMRPPAAPAPATPGSAAPATPAPAAPATPAPAAPAPPAPAAAP